MDRKPGTTKSSEEDAPQGASPGHSRNPTRDTGIQADRPPVRSSTAPRVHWSSDGTPQRTTRDRSEGTSTRPTKSGIKDDHVRRLLPARVAALSHRRYGSSSPKKDIRDASEEELSPPEVDVDEDLSSELVRVPSRSTAPGNNTRDVPSQEAEDKDGPGEGLTILDFMSIATGYPPVPTRSTALGHHPPDPPPQSGASSQGSTSKDNQATAAVVDHRDPLRVISGSILFNNVTFSYQPAENKPALRRITLHVAAGQKVVLVGTEDAGKTTLLKLLAGVVGAYSGAITIDGQDIRSVSHESLLRHVSVVPQAPAVFEGSVLDNVRLGTGAPRRVCVEACRIVGLHRRIMLFPGGYDEPIRAGEGGGGGGMEGGVDMGLTTENLTKLGITNADRQKLGVARALLEDNRIILFDKALSAVDCCTEKRILTYLRTWWAGRTVVTVPHRLGTITLSDAIYVMCNGMIVDGGTHAELMGRPGLYRQFWRQKDTI